MSAHRECKKRRYKRLSQELRDALGGRCRKCKVKKKRPLHFDIVAPNDGGRHHRKLGPMQRIRYYLAEYKRGNVQLLCNVCNGRKGAIQDRAMYARRRPAWRLDYWHEQELNEMQGQALASVMVDEVPF